MTERERLIQLIIESVDGWNVTQEGAGNIANYLLANGVVVLPCKVGDIVYWINQDKLYKTQFSLADMCGAFGKTVFLTREEAEKALKERESK